MSTARDLIEQTVTNTPGTSGGVTLGPATAGRLALVASDDGLPFDFAFTVPGGDTEVREDCVYTHSTRSLTRGTLASSTAGVDVAVNLTSATIARVVFAASRALPRDSNGAILANVAHRTGTLASLMALGGSAGEISTATDYPSLVLHTGNPGQARSLVPMQGVRIAAWRKTAAVPVATGVRVDVAGVTAISDPNSWLNTTTGVLTIPAIEAWSRLYVSGCGVVPIGVLSGVHVLAAYMGTAGTLRVAAMAAAEFPALDDGEGGYALGHFFGTGMLRVASTGSLAIQASLYQTQTATRNCNLEHFEVWGVPA